MPWKLNDSEQAPNRHGTFADGADSLHVPVRGNIQFVTDNQNFASASSAEIFHLKGEHVIRYLREYRICILANMENIAQSALRTLP
jgi:hypothetical protein